MTDKFKRKAPRRPPLGRRASPAHRAGNSRPSPATPKSRGALEELLKVMATLRSPEGCPWDREQDHNSLKFHAVEEVYELIDAIEAKDDQEMEEELGDVLLQVVFHSQLAQERGAFNFESVCQRIVSKLIHRHPHVFGTNKLKSAEAVLAQWEQLKRAEKTGTPQERPSALDGIPKHLPALLRAHSLVKKARRAKLDLPSRPGPRPRSQTALGRELFDLAEFAQRQGWNAEALLVAEIRRRDRALRQIEAGPLRPKTRGGGSGRLTSPGTVS